MSSTAAHESKRARRACQNCRERKARFRYRGAVRADRDHVLCFECFRSQRDRRRAQVLAAVRLPEPLPSPFGCRGSEFTERQIAHRQQMLEHLTAASRPSVR